MATDFRRGINYEPVISALLQKSGEGKIDWRETAEDETFLTSVKGEMTFEISRRGDHCQLIAKNRRGKTLFRLEEPISLSPNHWSLADSDEADQTREWPTTTLGKLHSIARRVAMRVDEQLSSSLRLIEDL